MADVEGYKREEALFPYPVLITVKSEEEDCKSPPREENGVHVHVVKTTATLDGHISEPLVFSHPSSQPETITVNSSIAHGGLHSKLASAAATTSPPSAPSSSTLPAPPQGMPGVPQDAKFNLTIPVMSSNDRFTPEQALNAGKQVVSYLESARRDTSFKLPSELQCSFEVVHKCLGVIYGTFFLNLYTKANAPTLLCRSCHGLYPPPQFIHHPCSGLQNLDIQPCRSRMWRRCLVPLVTPGMDKLQQKQRWKYCLEKFSHAQTGIVRRSLANHWVGHVLDMPELKKGRFVAEPGTAEEQGSEGGSVSTPTKQQVGGHGQSVSTLPPLTSMHTSIDGPPLLDAEEMEVFEEDSMEESTFIQHQTINPIPPLQFQALPPLSATTTTGEPSPMRPTLSPTTSPTPTPSALSLADSLVTAVKNLQTELATVQAKLIAAEQQLKEMPSESSMRMQLTELIATQQKLKSERDVAIQQSKMAEERAGRMERQLKELKILHSQLMTKLSAV